MLFLTDIRVTTTSTFHRMLLLALSFSTLVTFANGKEIIGVHLTDENGEGPAPNSHSDESIAGLMDPVMRLNRFTFEQTILQQHANEIPHWIILFCPPWYEPCQAVDIIFKQFGHKWQDQLNNAVLSTEVRFAAVDCATEKALCNTQNVDTYPFIAHYRNHEQVKVWRGKSFDTDKARLREFLRRELSPISTNTEPVSEDVTPESGQSFPMDFLLIFAAIAGNAWFIGRGSCGETPSSSATCGQQQEGVQRQDGAQRQEDVPLAQSAEQQVSTVARSLPKEWGCDRPTCEL